MRIEKLIVFVTCLLFLVACFRPITSTTAPVSDRLEVYHTNDLHAHVESLNEHEADCSADDIAKNKCFGGFARLVSAFINARSNNPEALFLDAGDQAQGSLYFKVFKTEPIILFNQIANYDVLTFGNHEFDSGTGYLDTLLENSASPYVSCNLDTSGNSTLNGRYQPYVIVEKGGQRYGIIGVLTEEANNLMPNIKGAKVQDVQTSVEKAVRSLENQGVLRIIVLSHIGLAEDRELARKVSGIDLIVGGHSHSRLAYNDPTAEGPYPIIEISPRGEKVAIVTDFFAGKYLGHLQVEFDKTGTVVTASGEPLLIDTTIPENKDVSKQIAVWKTELASFYGTVIAEAKIDLPSKNQACRVDECAIGNLVADAFLWSAHDKNPDFAIYNGGSIRAGIPKGPISMGRINEVLPFDTRVSTFKLQGRYIPEILELGVSRAEDPNNDGTGRFPQISGLKFKWDPTKPVGKRVSDIEIRKIDGKYLPVQPTETYIVASLDFIRNGGDGYDVLKTHSYDADDSGQLIWEALADYLKSHPVVVNTKEGRSIKLQTIPN